MSNKTYDIIKWIAQILLPASATLYFALCKIWGLPNGEEVVATITAIDTFLGILLGITSTQYKKNESSDGTFLIDTSNPHKDVYRLSVNGDFDRIKGKDSIRLKVDPNANLSRENQGL